MSTNTTNTSVTKFEHAKTKFNEALTFEALRSKLENFAADRDWNQFHTPRNLALALVGEVGELCECFQWKGESLIESWSERERAHLGEELSDVLMYLIRLADKCNIDLPIEVLAKLEANGKKYPAKLVHGSSKKYSEYES